MSHVEPRWMKCLLFAPAGYNEFRVELKRNFTQCLSDRESRLIGRLELHVKPGDPKVVQAIEAAM